MLLNLERPPRRVVKLNFLAFAFLYLCHRTDKAQGASITGKKKVLNLVPRENPARTAETRMCEDLFFEKPYQKARIERQKKDIRTVSLTLKWDSAKTRGYITREAEETRETSSPKFLWVQSAIPRERPNVTSTINKWYASMSSTSPSF